MRGRVGERVAVLVLVAGLPASALAQGDPLAEPFPAVVRVSDLDGRIGFRIDSVRASDRMGWSVGALGDFNGDGVDDVIIGAPFANPGGTEPGGGKAFILFGSATGFPAIFDAADLDGSNGLVLQGARGPFDSGERAGNSVAGAGDLNGDGVADAVVGAESAGVDRHERLAGKSYVVFGRADGVFDPTMQLADVDGSTRFAVFGIDPGDINGSAVSSAGDTNGDGFDDVLIGARGGGEGVYSGGGYYPYYFCCPGEAYVIYGRDVAGGASFPAVYEFGPGGVDEGKIIRGGDETANVGHAVSSAGDINGDGIDDVVVGAPETGRYYGATHVVFGRPAGLPAVIDVRSLNGTNGFSLVSRDLMGGVYSGSAVDRAGDVNGDGMDDLIIGSRLKGSYVVFGRTGGFPAEVVLDDLDGTDGFQITGRLDSDVAGVGDLNGDGVDDFAIGNRNVPLFGDELTGSVFVVYGTGDGFPARLDLQTLDGTNGFRIDGVERGEGIGHAISSAGDINDDGSPDLLIGKFNQLTGDSEIGAYVLYGRAPACRADLDGDGSLTIFDFLEFQNLFDAGDPIADFDGDGRLTLFDFLAYQNAFDAGC